MKCGKPKKIKNYRICYQANNCFQTIRRSLPTQFCFFNLSSFQHFYNFVTRVIFCLSKFNLQMKLDWVLNCSKINGIRLIDSIRKMVMLSSDFAFSCWICSRKNILFCLGLKDAKVQNPGSLTFSSKLLAGGPWCKKCQRNPLFRWFITILSTSFLITFLGCLLYLHSHYFVPVQIWTTIIEGIISF